MNFFKQTWVMVMACIFIAIGATILILGGVSVGDISNLVKLVAGIITAIGLLVVAIKAILQKKDATKK